MQVYTVDREFVRCKSSVHKDCGLCKQDCSLCSVLDIHLWLQQDIQSVQRMWVDLLFQSFVCICVVMYRWANCILRRILYSRWGRAIAQAVSRWLRTAAARVRSRVWSSGICGGQSGAGTGFLWVLRFPLPIFIPPIAPQSPSPIIWGWYNRPEVAAVQGT
jgi:hypothetical protein